MITVKYIKKPKELSISLKGHACYDTAGKDLVCASASILIYALAQTVMESRCASVIELSPADSMVKVVPDYKSRDSLTSAFEFAMTGYRLLEHNYPNNVRLEAE